MKIRILLLIFGLSLLLGFVIWFSLPKKIVAKGVEGSLGISSSYIPSVKFYYKDNILYWKINEENKPENFVKLQLDHLDPPTINQDPIESIAMIGITTLRIYTRDKYWDLQFAGNEIDWYMKDWKSL